MESGRRRGGGRDEEEVSDPVPPTDMQPPLVRAGGGRASGGLLVGSEERRKKWREREGRAQRKREGERKGCAYMYALCACESVLLLFPLLLVSPNSLPLPPPVWSPTEGRSMVWGEIECPSMMVLYSLSLWTSSGR